MPRDLTAYHAFYDLNMERISRSGLGTIAFEALSWICAVARPLSPTELQVALSMKKGLREIEMHNVPSIDDVISACAGMVIVDRNASVVRLIHRTAEEYFQKTWERWIPKAHETIMESCISYLSLQQFALGTCSSFQEYYGKIEKYPLFDYVSRNWGYHASKTKIRSDELPAAFRHSYAILQASYRAIFGPHSYRQDIPFPPRNAPTLCLLAHFGIPIAEVMLKGRIDNTESYYRTPLSHAIQEGHTNIALQLLKHGASPHTENWDGSTPFLFAVINANRRLIQAILDGEGNDISRICSHTPTSAYNQPSCFLPLCAAAGQVEIVEIILNYMDNERSKRSEFNLLSAKIWSKREVQRSEANYENKLRDRAMLAAAREGHDTIVTMLCGRGLNIEARDNNGCSPLSLAVQNGRDTTVQCLLSLGANIEIQDNAGRTPLHYAVRSNNLPVIQMLLGRNGRIDGRDGAGYTALFYAVRGKNVAVLKCLVEKSMHSKGYYLLFIQMVRRSNIYTVANFYRYL
jgi:ankyrin repeat protein